MYETLIISKNIKKFPVHDYELTDFMGKLAFVNNIQNFLVNILCKELYIGNLIFDGGSLSFLINPTSNYAKLTIMSLNEIDVEKNMQFLFKLIPSEIDGIMINDKHRLEISKRFNYIF